MALKEMRDSSMPLADRINAALERIYNGHAGMRIPAEATDHDVVLADCRERIAELEASVERLSRVKDAAIRYYFNWMQDEATDPTVCTEQQHREAAAVKDALEAYPSEKAKRAADAIMQAITAN